MTGAFDSDGSPAEMDGLLWAHRAGGTARFVVGLTSMFVSCGPPTDGQLRAARRLRRLENGLANGATPVAPGDAAGGSAAGNCHGGLSASRTSWAAHHTLLVNQPASCAAP